jgi:ATP-dependent RNA helicase DHX29
MAPRKKRKPVSNPARGFATTSIASKPKTEKQAEVEEEPPSQEKPTEPQGPELRDQSIVPKLKDVSQTPEELEAQLEHDELQLLVEKHGSKARRESRRQVSKLQTDQRVLRLQAQYMTVNDWLPKELLLDIISLARAESNDYNRRTGQQPLLRVLSEEEAILKLWTLSLVLKDLGFPDSSIQAVLKWLCANVSNVDPSASVSGLQECLEWLALDQDGDHQLLYDASLSKPMVSQSRDSSTPGNIRRSIPSSLATSQP